MAAAAGRASAPGARPTPFVVATTKLSADWSANRAVPHISPDWLAELLADEQLAGVEPPQKIRLLLAGLLALDAARVPPTPAAGGSAGGGGSSSDAALLDQGVVAQRAEAQRRERCEALAGELARLRAVVAADADEWAKITAAAAGALDGRLDLEAVMQQSSVVQETVTGLRQQAAAATNAHLLPPLQNLYLQNQPSVLQPDAGHFVVRQNPRVQPLSAGFSYATTTPPPSLHPPRFGEAKGQASFLRTSRQQQPPPERPPRAPAGSQQAAAGGSGLSRARSGVLGERHHSIQVLGEDDMQAIREAHLKAGGSKAKHGFAVNVRQEQVVWEKPARPPAAAAAASGASQQPGAASPQRGAERGSPPHDEAAAAAAAAAAGGSPGAHDAMDAIDELFACDDSDEDGGSAGARARSPRRAAATGLSRTRMHHLARRASAAGQDSSEGEGGGGGAMPDELADDVELEVLAGTAGASGRSGEPPQPQPQPQLQPQQREGAARPRLTLRGAGRGGGAPPPSGGGGVAPASVAAKRRRVIEEDDEDDD